MRRIHEKSKKYGKYVGMFIYKFLKYWIVMRKYPSRAKTFDLFGINPDKMASQENKRHEQDRAFSLHHKCKSSSRIIDHLAY